MKYTLEFCTKIYEEYISNEEYIGISSVGKKMGLSNKQSAKLISKICRFFNREDILKIYRHRLTTNKISIEKRIETRKKSGVPWHSPDTKDKISKSNIEAYKNNPELREKARKSMIEVVKLGKTWTEESNKKRVESRKNNGVPWHSNETRDKISIAQKNKVISEEHKNKLKDNIQFTDRKVGWHESGIIPDVFSSIEYKDRRRDILLKHWKLGTFKKIYQSKSQLEILNILIQKYSSVKAEFFIEGKPYDIYIEDLNLIIEFNGTFWHRDPRFYTETENMVIEIWTRDENKKNIAIRNGYNFITIWQYDWETINSTENKLKYLEDIINGKVLTTNV